MKTVFSIKKNKLVLIFATLLLWVLMGFNTQNPDYSYYENLFVRAKSGVSYYAVEAGFWYLVKLCSRIGMDYGLFLKLYSLVGILLIAKTVERYTEKPSAVLLAYFLYPFMLDVVQIRQFMACAIFVYAIRYLEKFNIKNLISYCVLVLIAASQQVMALAFLFFMLAYVSNTKKAIRYASILMIVMFLTYRIIPNLSIVRGIMEIRNKELDYSGGIGDSQFILYAIFYFFLIFMSWFVWRGRINKTNTENKLEITANYNQTLLKVGMYSAAFIPFILLDFQFTRLFRASLIIIYCCIIEGIRTYKSRYKMILSFSCFGVMLLVGIKLFGPGSGYYSTITTPIFQNNEIFNLLFGWI